MRTLPNPPNIMAAMSRKFGHIHWSYTRVAVGLVLLLCFAAIIMVIGRLGTTEKSQTVFAASTQGCFLASDNILSPSEMLGKSDDFQCQNPDIPDQTQQIWLQIPIEQSAIQAAKVNLEGNSAPFASLSIVHQNDEGAMASRSFTPDDIIRAWTAGTRYSIELTDKEAQSDILWLGINRPWSKVALESIEIMPRSVAEEQRFDRSIWFGIYTGLGLVPIIYSLVFFFALRYRFMGWHALMAACFASYTLHSSGLIIHLWPQIDMWTRTLASYASMSLAVGLAGYFALSFLEEGAVPKWSNRLMLWASHLLIANAAFIIFLGPSLPFLARNIYHAMYLPSIIAFFICLTCALLNKSNAVWFLIAGWSLTFIVAVDRILRGLDIYVLPNEIDFSLYFCLSLEVIITACGVAFRVMSIRKERDQAKMREEELTRQATTDLLTGLSNRRQFDEHFSTASGITLALIDIDNFKQVNDKYGHQYGDEVLRILGKILQRYTQQNWCEGVYRLGGEEFAVLLSTQGEDASAICCEQIRAEIEQSLQKEVDILAAPVTVSIGLSTSIGLTERAVYRNADVALYHAKSEGRNRVAIASNSYGSASKPFLQIAVQKTRQKFG